MRTPTTRLVLWFRCDLRLHDNPILTHAASQAGDKEVLPVYCFDPRSYGTTPFGSPKTGTLRAKFLLESVLDLRAKLRELGSDLLVGYGRPEDIIPRIVSAAGEDGIPANTELLWQEQVTSEELSVDRALRSALPAGTVKTRAMSSGLLYAKQDLPFRPDLNDLPDVFTPFRNKVESKCSIPKPLPPPGKGSLPLPKSLGLPDDLMAGFDFVPNASTFGYDAHAFSVAADARGVMPFLGGESVALSRLKHYLWDKDCLKSYFETRNGMLGADYSSKFAPWLAHGCLSPRLVASECARYETARVKNKSTYWLVFELLWRDFYRLYCEKHGSKVFWPGGPIGEKPEWVNHAPTLARWKEGKTGMPLVDANMRELAATGFMSNRGRQNVASYLALDLQLDWRKGADHFESLLLDYDVCSNWGNWVAAAGLTGGRVNRFNIAKQSKDYDADGEYLRHWLPELKDVPAPQIHEPWTMSKSDQEKYNVRIGVDYPEPPRSKFRYRNDGDDRGRRQPYSRPASARGSGPGGGRGGRGRGRDQQRVQHRY